MNIIPSLPK